IQKHAGEQIDGAVREVLKAPVRWDTLYLIGNAVTGTPPAGSDKRELTKAYVGFDAAGARIGDAVVAAEPGFQELLTLMIGFDPSTGALTGYKVLDQKETPGLGDKVEVDKSFGAQFAGRIVPLKGVKTLVAGNPGQVQTITGATISSRAVIRIINNAVAKWRPLLEAHDRRGPRGPQFQCPDSYRPLRRARRRWCPVRHLPPPSLLMCGAASAARIPSWSSSSGCARRWR